MAEVQESVPADTTEVAEAAPAQNGTTENGVNGVNGHEPAADEAPTKKGGKDETEPPSKKPRKSVTKTAEKRRSSSRLQNHASGTQLPKEISSENLPKGAR